MQLGADKEINKKLNGIKNSFDKEKKLKKLEDYVLDLDDSDRKKKEVAEEIFNSLNLITLNENRKNDKYLADFKLWLSEKTKSGKSKDEIFKLLKRVYNYFTIHSQKSKNGFKNSGDIDAEASLLLLEICGFKNLKNNNIDFVLNGETGKGLNLDTGGGGGINIENYEKKSDGKFFNSLFNSKLILDEHGGGPSSTTRMVYEILKELHKIPQFKMNQITRFVQFVDIVDSLYYQTANIVPSSNQCNFRERTIFGLYRSLPIDLVFNYFKNTNKTGFEYLSDEFLKKEFIEIYNYKSGKIEKKYLSQISAEKTENLNIGNDQVNNCLNNGEFLEYKGKNFIVDLGGNINSGSEMAQYHDCGIIQIFNETGDVYIYSPIVLPSNIAGFDVIRYHFIVDKIGSNKNIEKLLNEFKIVSDHKLINNQIEKGSDKQIKQKILNFRNNIIERKNEKNKLEFDHENIENFKSLPKLERSDIMVGKFYDGIVNNAQKNCAYITLNCDMTITGILHKNNILNPDLLKSIKKGDKVKYKVKSIDEGGDKINFSDEK